MSPLCDDFKARERTMRACLLLEQQRIVWKRKEQPLPKAVAVLMDRFGITRSTAYRYAADYARAKGYWDCMGTPHAAVSTKRKSAPNPFNAYRGKAA